MQESYEVETSKRETDIESSWFELERTHDYADQEKYSLADLHRIVRKWQDEKKNPLRSPRSIEDAETIVQRAVYEVYCREREERQHGIQTALTNTAFKAIISD